MKFDKNTLFIGLSGIVLLAVMWFFGTGDSGRNQFNPEFDLTSELILFDLEIHDTRKELNSAFDDWVGVNVRPKGFEHIGWSTWDVEKRTCTIHIDRELVDGPFEKFENTVGHEVLHCYYGRYHD